MRIVQSVAKTAPSVAVFDTADLPGGKTNNLHVLGRGHMMKSPYVEQVATDEPGYISGFVGIASDSREDVDNESITAEQLNVDYAKLRGYVNYSHKSDLQNTIGYLTDIRILMTDEDRDEVPPVLQPVPATATLYVEGKFYRGYRPVEELLELMKLAEAGGKPMGISIEGRREVSEITESADGSLSVKFNYNVHGIAITPAPAQVYTALYMAKNAGAPVSLPSDIAVSFTASKLRKLGVDAEVAEDRARKLVTALEKVS